MEDLIPSPFATRTRVQFPFVGRVDRSPCRYVYVLRLADGRLYVGTTADPERRMAQHREAVSSMATRRSLPVALQALYRFRECYYAGRPASERVEMHVAAELADRCGEHLIQGARHGSGERLFPTARGWKVIRKTEKFMHSAMVRRLLARVETLNPREYGWLLTQNCVAAATDA